MLENYKRVDSKNPIEINLVTTQGHMQPYYHWHTHYEILFIESGKVTVESNTTVIKSDRPFILVHRPYCLHKLCADNDFEYKRYVLSISKSAFIGFSQNIVDLSLFAEASLIVCYPNEKEFNELVGLCAWLTDTVGGYSNRLSQNKDFKKGSLISVLILHILKSILEDGRGNSYMTEQSYIQDALQYVGENLGEALTIEEISEHFGVGRTKFMEDFKSLTGQTYKKYLTELRMNRAIELLRAGQSIIDISFELGYSSEAHFIKAFREFYKTTPKKFDFGGGANKLLIIFTIYEQIHFR